jgi:hypothetical protein
MFPCDPDSIMKARWDFETAGGLIAAGGVGLAAMGSALRLPSAGLVGLVVLGLGVCCWGISGLAEGRILFFSPGVRHRQSHYGWAARAWGVLLCLAGLAISGAGILLLLKPDVSLEQALYSSLGKGAGMFFCGMIGLLYSVTLIAGRAEDEGGCRKIMTLLRRAFGTLVLILSALVATAGLARVLAPETYVGVVRAISESLRPEPK